MHLDNTYYKTHSPVNSRQKKSTDRVASICTFNSRKSFQVCIKYIHLFNQTGKRCFCGFTNFFIYSLSL